MKGENGKEGDEESENIRVKDGEEGRDGGSMKGETKGMTEMKKGSMKGREKSRRGMEQRDGEK